MPIAEQIGQDLPKRLPTWGVFAVAFALGVLCTYAEPAIASLRPLASIVKRESAPYLYLMLNDFQEVLVLSIALGVGFAAILGTLRFLKNWSLKPLIVGCLVPTVGCACYMQWGDPTLQPLLGLAWDCGAVTTGPVTVPILLALGIGVIRSAPRRRSASVMLKSAVEANSGQQSSLEGFGIVTLASLLPVLAVEVLGIILSFTHSLDDILRDPVTDTPAETIWDKTPVKELTFAVRAVVPLVAALLLLVYLVLRATLPPLSIFLAPGDEGSSGDAKPSRRKPKLIMWGDVMWDDSLPVSQLMDDLAMTPPSTRSTRTAPSQDGGSREPSPHPQELTAPPSAAKSFTVLLGGTLMAVVGMAMFNVGLTYGFTSIGDQVGQVLPASFLRVDAEADSPLYPYGVGITITLATVFMLGVLATRAEPALNVLGKTVEKLSRGTFSKNMLIYSVCLGVGGGMAMGATKILFGVPIIYFILIKYTITMLLTAKAPESFANIAWDSAGVTTGPVTVPFVLSTGIGFCKAADCTEGFGILTNASVGPIIMVLLVQAVRVMRCCRKQPKAQVGTMPSTGARPKEVELRAAPPTSA